MALPNTVLSGRYDTQSNPFDASVAGNTVGIYRSGQYYTSIGVSGFGLSAAVLTVEATPDNGATWVAAQARQNAVDTLGGTISADGFYLVVSGLATHLRLRVTTAGPTTLTVSCQGGQDKDLSALSLGGGASDPAVAAGIGAPADPAWDLTGPMTLISGIKTLTNKVVSGVLSVTLNGMLPAGTNFLGYFSLPTTTYAKTSAASSLVVKSAAGTLAYAYAIPSATGYLIAIDATTAPASGAAVTPIALWPATANQPTGGSYTDAPIPVTSGLVLLMSSSATVYTPITATFIQGGAR